MEASKAQDKAVGAAVEAEADAKKAKDALADLKPTGSP